MTTPSNAASGRFRRAEIVESTPTQELHELLDDGPRMYARYEELLRAAGQAGDLQAVLQLAATARGATDPQRVHATQRLAAALLLALAEGQDASDHASRAVVLDHALQVLVPELDREPHEPELLQQLGEALRLLGEAELAHDAFEVVLSLEPEHDAAAAALADSGPLGVGARSDASTAPTLHAMGGTIRSILDRAVQVDDRTISLCMIVRDEEEMLPDCLRSVVGAVDQLVVVDTGSTDRTRQIAREFGATVVEFEWTGSFSDARNESLRHATGDWILWLDADERLVEGDAATVRELARRTWVEGWHVVETHFLGSGDEGTASHAPMRLFQRREHYQWRGTVHEQVAWALPAWLPGRVRHSTVRIDHYGYLTQVVQEREKGRRNLELLMAQHHDSPSAFTSYNIGSEHAGAGNWDEAHAWLERSLAEARASQGDWTTQPWTPLLVQRATGARRMVGDRAGAIELAGEGLAAWPDYTDLAWERARAHADLGDWELAAAEARHALELGDAPARYVAVTGRGGFQARHVLAQALRGSGDLAAARTELERTIEEAPHYLPALEELVDLLLVSGESPERVDELVDGVLGERANSAAANQVVGACLHEAGNLDLADARYERVLAARPSHASALVAQAEVRLAQREFEAAWELGMRVDPLDRLAPAGAQSSLLAAAALGRADLVAGPADRIEQAGSLPATERAVYVAWRQLLVPGSGVRALVPTDPLAREVLLRNLHALALVHATDAFEVLHGLVQAVIPDAYERGVGMSDLYLRLSFADMAGDELMQLAQRFGPDARILTGLGKVATIKQMWEDAEVFLGESLQLDPAQPEAEQLLAAVQQRRHA